MSKSDTSITSTEPTPDNTEWFSRVDVISRFEPHDHAMTFELLQSHPGFKVLDLCKAKIEGFDLFSALAAHWHVPPGTVPKLAIVMTFDQWAVFRALERASSKELTNLGVTVALLYQEQAHDDSLKKWFSDGAISHNAVAVLEWLRTCWPCGPLWPVVLTELSQLLSQHVDKCETVAGLYTDAAEVALRCEPFSESCNRAAAFAEEAMGRFENAASVNRCRALSLLGDARIGQGQATDGLSLLDQAVSMARKIGALEPGANALRSAGLHALDCNDFRLAEEKFRAALAFYPAGPSRLLAVLHHNLAFALMSQGRDDLAEQHATTALSLREDKDSELAQEDQRLLDQLRERR